MVGVIELTIAGIVLGLAIWEYVRVSRSLEKDKDKKSAQDADRD